MGSLRDMNVLAIPLFQVGEKFPTLGAGDLPLPAGKRQARCLERG